MSAPKFRKPILVYTENHRIAACSTRDAAYAVAMDRARRFGLPSRIYVRNIGPIANVSAAGRWVPWREYMPDDVLARP